MKKSEFFLVSSIVSNRTLTFYFLFVSITNLLFSDKDIQSLSREPHSFDITWLFVDIVALLSDMAADGSNNPNQTGKNENVW